MFLVADDNMSVLELGAYANAVLGPEYPFPFPHYRVVSTTDVISRRPFTASEYLQARSQVPRRHVPVPP